MKKVIFPIMSIMAEAALGMTSHPTYGVPMRVPSQTTTLSRHTPMGVHAHNNVKNSVVQVLLFRQLVKDGILPDLNQDDKLPAAPSDLPDLLSATPSHLISTYFSRIAAACGDADAMPTDALTYVLFPTMLTQYFLSKDSGTGQEILDVMAILLNRLNDLDALNMTAQKYNVPILLCDPMRFHELFSPLVPFVQRYVKGEYLEALSAITSPPRVQAFRKDIEAVRQQSATSEQTATDEITINLMPDEELLERKLAEFNSEAEARKERIDEQISSVTATLRTAKAFFKKENILQPEDLFSIDTMENTLMDRISQGWSTVCGEMNEERAKFLADYDSRKNELEKKKHELLESKIEEIKTVEQGNIKSLFESYATELSSQINVPLAETPLVPAAPVAITLQPNQQAPADSTAASPPDDQKPKRGRRGRKGK